jgi:hypothetical protein
VLVGVKINARNQASDGREGTADAPKPFGKRGAEMADTVGNAKT